MKRIAIAVGGYSAEKIISLKSGEVVTDCLENTDFECYTVLIEEDQWCLKINSQSYLIDKSDFTAIVKNEKISFDGVFIAIHGIPGENGQLQEYLDKLNIPYTSSSARASKISFDKGACNDFLRKNHIPCAQSIKIRSIEDINIDDIIENLQLPCFIKPNANGSSFGISKVKTKDQIIPAVENAFKFDDVVLVESYLPGTEVTCGVHNFDSEIQTLPITEIVSQNEFFDFEAKYEGKSNEITPARLTEDIANLVSSTTKTIYTLLELNGIARVDYKIVEGIPHIIEVNTIPGFSKESIIPQQANYAGIDLKDLFLQSLNQLFS
ncbi:MAG: D-alanine--D-alanine ligase [Flavobacteriales bacterium]